MVTPTGTMRAVRGSSGTSRCGIWRATVFGPSSTRSTDAFIGWLGVTKVWDPPELLGASEVGWFIDRRYWGQGLATEGAGEALRFALGRWDSRE